jgi:hypothetical protein
MNTVRHKSIMFAIISLLAVSLIYSSFSEVLFAAPRDPRWGSGSTCNFDTPGDTSTITCCWREQIPGSVLGEAYCQSCTWDELTGSYSDCDPKELQMRPLPEGDLPQAEIVPPNRTLPGGGDLPTLEQVPEETGTIEAHAPGGCAVPGPCPAFPPPPPPPPPPNHVVPQTPLGGAEITEQNLPELVPTCLEGQVLDEETNLCVPVESQGVEQPEVQQLEPQEPEEEQSEPEEEQPSEEVESDSGDEGN